MVSDVQLRIKVIFGSTAWLHTQTQSGIYSLGITVLSHPRTFVSADTLAADCPQRSMTPKQMKVRDRLVMCAFQMSF